jgi:hypothetical protein
LSGLLIIILGLYSLSVAAFLPCSCLEVRVAAFLPRSV